MKYPICEIQKELLDLEFIVVICQDENTKIFRFAGEVPFFELLPCPENVQGLSFLGLNGSF
jgi:hypothetical protein